MIKVFLALNAYTGFFNGVFPAKFVVLLNRIGSFLCPEVFDCDLLEKFREFKVGDTTTQLTIIQKTTLSLIGQEYQFSNSHYS